MRRCCAAPAVRYRYTMSRCRATRILTPMNIANGTSDHPIRFSMSNPSRASMYDSAIVKGTTRDDRRDRVGDVPFDLVVEREDAQIVVRDEIGEHETGEEDRGKDHRHATPHGQDLPRVRRWRELHRDGERHQDVTAFAPRAGEDERDHDHDEHGEGRVVLHVDEPGSEAREFRYRRAKKYHRASRKYQRDSATNSAASSRTTP